MAYSDDRWWNAFSCEPMFLKSFIEEVRSEEFEDYSVTSEYVCNRLIPCSPVWWNNGICHQERNSEFSMMWQHFVDPSSQQLSPLYHEFKTRIQITRYNAVKDVKGVVTTLWWNRSQRVLTGMPILNSVSVGTPVTKLPKPVGAERLQAYNKCTSKEARLLSYSFEDRFVEPLIPLIVHYFYEVVHGPDYIHTHKGERLRDSLLCLGNLKVSYPIPRPVIDKVIMNYIFSGKKLSEDNETLAKESPDEAFNYNEVIVRDRMFHSPSDVGSVTRFFTNVAVVANVLTSKEVKSQKNSVSSQLFAGKVSNLFESLEDKTSIQHKETIALYGKLLCYLCFHLLCKCVLISFRIIGMLAMFSAKFAYKIGSTMFKYRPNNENKSYAEDLLSSTIDRIEFCLTKHIVFLLDNFGLFPTLRDDINIDNKLEQDVLIVFSAYNKVLVPSKLYESVIEDEERELDKLKTDADVLLETWDEYYRNTNRNRPMGIAWPLRQCDVAGLPPIAHIVMAWGKYIGRRFKLIEDFLVREVTQNPSMTSNEQGDIILKNPTLNMYGIFRGCEGRTVLMKQIKKNGMHAWGGNRVVGIKTSPYPIADTASFDCFDILSSSKYSYNLLDFASKLVMPSASPSQFNCKNLIRDSSSLVPFRIENASSQRQMSVPVLTPGVFEKTWTTNEVDAVSSGRIPDKASKSPKMNLFQGSSASVVSVLAVRRNPSKDSRVTAILHNIDISYGSRNCEVQLVNMIMLQKKLQLTDEEMFDRNTYSVLHDYCELKNLKYRLCPLSSYSLSDWKQCFLKYYSKVRASIEPVLDDLKSGNQVGQSGNLRIRDRSKGNNPSTRRPSVESESNDDSSKSDQGGKNLVAEKESANEEEDVNDEDNNDEEDVNVEGKEILDEVDSDDAGENKDARSNRLLAKIASDVSEEDEIVRRKGIVAEEESMEEEENREVEETTEDNVDISSGANMADKLDHPVDHTAEDYKMEVEGDDSSKTKTSSKKKTSKKRGRKRTRTAD